MKQNLGSDILGEEAILPLLFRMALPATVAMIINALYNVVDTIFVGHGVGPLAIAALSIIFPLQMLVSSFAQAVSVGAASITSRRLGAKDPEAAARATGTAYTIIVATTFLIIMALIIFKEPVLRLFGATDEIMPYAIDYISIVGPGFFFFALGMGASNLIRAEGNARSSMIGMAIGAITNIILDPILIIVMGLGVRGAAIATIIGQFLSCVYFFSLYIRKKSHIPIVRTHLKPDFSLIPEMAILGVPVFVQSAGMSILQLAVNNTLGTYGGNDAIATYGMISRLFSIVIFPIVGISQGFQPIAGYNYGAKRFDRVKSSLRLAILVAFLTSLIGYFIMMLAPQFCMALFGAEGALRMESARVLRIMGLGIPLAAIQITGSIYFQSVGKPNESFILGISRQFLILLPLILILSRFCGTSGVWISFPISDVMSMLITVILLIREVRHLGEYSSESPSSVENGK